jgi:hypothetical protein
MKTKLLEDPLICPAFNSQMAGLALHNRQGVPGGIPGFLIAGQTTRIDEQLRLRRSWEAVLTEIRPPELGASRW